MKKLAIIALIGLMLLSIPGTAFEENVGYDEDTSVSVERSYNSPGREKPFSFKYILAAAFGLLITISLVYYKKR